jgi:hypothetical protein
VFGSVINKQAKIGPLMPTNRLGPGAGDVGPKPHTSRPSWGHRIFPHALRGATVERPTKRAVDITCIPASRGSSTG